MLGAIALLGGLTLLGVRTLLTRESAPQMVDALVVETLMVEPVESYTVARTYTGEVVAGRTSELGFEQGGELVEVLVDRGDRITAGEPLARLDTRRLQAQRAQLMAQRDRAQAELLELQNGPRREAIASAQSSVQDLENQLELERLRQERREVLYTEGAISLEDRDVVAFGADALEERLAAARSQLEELQNGTRPEQLMAQQATVEQLAASIADLDIAIEKSTIFAPFSGAIAARRLDEGAIVEAGQPILRLVEQAEPEVEVGLPLEAIANLNAGGSFPVSIGGQPYDAAIAAILPEVDSTTRTQTVVLRLPSTAATNLSPDQLADIELAQTIDEEGIWLPLSALTQGDRGLWSAFAVQPTEESDDDLFQVERRQVEVLHTEGDRAFVRGVLVAGDRVITDGVQRLVPGQQVQLMD
ncbi:efflux RND transporter periplasmic adaptor subunit [filamentous cyanobacterium LEGE 07170]|nr:efflux RND transporter periplasmic adaptor subunit [filamentous cyanobacterium LEGE 07170]